MEKDPSVSTSLVKTVMGRLKHAAAGGSDEARMEAIQALVDVLQGEGHYAKLILGTAASVRKQAVSLAQARYNGIMKRKCHGADFPPFRPESVDLSCYPEQVCASGLLNELSMTVKWCLWCFCVNRHNSRQNTLRQRMHFLFL